ncbi:MAG TPA: DEAD/DEAH box helicase [Phenylobacterium sp.]|nr:DEAD/DEAH box helicase [Phenylobacterium sp.]
MFDAQSAALIRSAPPIADVDPKNLPQILTRTYAQLVALRLRSTDPEAVAQAERFDESLLRLAAVYEGIVDTSEDGPERRGAAFVAATAYQILARVSDADEPDRPLLTPDAIHPRVAAPLLFIIAGQSPDAREAGARLTSQGDHMLLTALIESIRDLARENLKGIVDRAERLADTQPNSDNGLVGQVEQTLYGLCWAGLVEMAALVLDRPAPKLVFRRFDGPADTFSQVERLATFQRDGRPVSPQVVSTYAGPRHLARLLQHASRQFIGHGLATLPAPLGANENLWRPWLKRRAEQKPIVWPNHRLAIDQGLLEPGRSAVLVLPTGAGKTTLSELKIAATIASGKSVIFLAPTLALVDQLKDDFSKSFASGLGEIVVSADGDLSILSHGPSLSEIEVMTPERLLAMLSFADADLSDVGLIVFDECHLLAPQGGGKRSLDAMLCLLQATRRAPDADLLLLSAMLTNGDQLAAWIEGLTGRPALYFHDAWKPSRQARGVVIYPDADLRQVLVDRQAGKEPAETYEAHPHALFGLQQNWLPENPVDWTVVSLMDETVSLTCNGQRLTPTANVVAAALAGRAGRAGLKTIVFVQQADYAPKTAERVAKSGMGPWPISKAERTLMADIALELGGDRSLVKAQAGAVPHNGDMIPLERRLAESLFRRDDGPSVIVATPTLAQGINLPAQVALLAGDKRVDLAGREDLKPHELLNAAGRAGRAGFLANGMVLLIPEPVVGFNKGQSNKLAFNKLRSILPENDRCVTVEDPIGLILDQIQDGAFDARVEYFVNRMRSGEPQTADAAAVQLARKSFAAFQAERQGLEFDTAITALEQALVATPLEKDEHGTTVAALTGLPRGAVAVLAEHLGADPKAFPTSIEAWISWIVAFFRAESDAATALVGDLDTIKAVVRGRKSAPKITDDEWKRLEQALLGWVRGLPFADIELLLGVEPKKVRVCKRTRDLVLKVVHRNLYIVATALAELAKQRLPLAADGTRSPPPAVLEVLAYALRTGFNTPDKTAYHQLHPEIRTRVGLHQAFEALLGGGNPSPDESYLGVYKHVKVIKMLFEDD